MQSSKLVDYEEDEDDVGSPTNQMISKYIYNKHF